MIIAAVRSVATYVAVSLYVLFAAPIGMLLAAIFRWKGILYIFGHGGVRLALALCRHQRARRRAASTFRSTGPPSTAPTTRATSIRRSSSTALHPRMHILYKAEINAIPLLARAFRHGGFIPIDRRNKEAAMRSLEAGAQSIRAGNSFLIFPEGTRSKTDELLPFKKGGFLMAHEGAGADRAGRDSGRPRRDAAGQPDHPPGDDQHPRRRADRDRRAAAGRSRRADRAGPRAASRRCSPRGR